MKVLIDIRKKSLEAYPYKTTKLGKIYFPRVDSEQPETKTWEDFGITDSYFGGNIHGIASIAGKPWYILYNQRLETLGIMHQFSRLKEYAKDELQSLCDLQGLAYSNENKIELIGLLTTLET